MDILETDGQGRPYHNKMRIVGLLLVLLFALGVRLAGITWGLPNSLHYFSYHPDESIVLMHSLPAFPNGIDIIHGRFLPHFYNYGSLHLILIALACVIGTGYHFIGPLAGPSGAIDPVAMAHALLAARLLSVAMGVGTVWATYAIGVRLWGPIAGLLAALLLAAMPLHAQHSHFATVDVPATLWTTLSILWAVKCLPGQAGAARTRSFVICGLFAGLATATKYNCAVVILALLAAGHISAWSGPKRLASALISTGLGVLAAAVSFAICCPGALLDRAKFLMDLRFEQTHVYKHPEIYFQHTGPGWWCIIAHNLTAAEGWLPLAMSMIGIAYAARRRERGDGVLGVFAIAYFVLISLAASRYARYEIPLLPVLALWAARPLADLAVRRRGIATGLSALLIASAALQLVGAVRPMTRPDARDVIASRILAMNPPPAEIGFASTPWFWTPPLNPYFSLPEPWQWLRFQSETRAHSALVIDPKHPFNIGMMQQYRPAVVVLSELEYYDRLRLQDPAAREYCRYLQQHYSIVACMTTDPFAKRVLVDGLPASGLPPDMLYVSPITLLCLRRGI